MQKCDDPSAPRFTAGVRSRSMRSRSQPPSRSAACNARLATISAKASIAANRNSRVLSVPRGAPVMASISPFAAFLPRLTACSPKSVRYSAVTVVMTTACVTASIRRLRPDGPAFSPPSRRMPAPSVPAVATSTIGVRHSSGQMSRVSASRPSVNSQ
ncbi:MAG: hypothetical protein IPK52_26010 [Chloroflexi bacterium]|nr:hypothetical protein [Chloroflexota bacterium]